MLRIFLIVASSMVAGLAGAADFYVAPGGNNNNAGTQAAPFATLQKGHDVAVAGDTVFMRGGTYSPTATTVLTRDGTSASARITITNFAGEKPIIDAINIPAGTSSFGIRMTDADWYLIKGIELRNSAEVGLEIQTGSSNNIIEFNNIHHSGRSSGDGRGIRIIGSGISNNTWLNNDVHHNFNTAADPGQHSDGVLYSPTSSSGNVFRGNRFFRNGDDGLDTFCVTADAVCAVGTVDKNWSYQNGCTDAAGTACGGELAAPGSARGKGFKLGGGRPGATNGGLTYTNNLSWKNRDAGFDNNCSDPDTNDGCRGNILNNNTAWNNPSNYIFFGIGSTFRNNISFGNLGSVAEPPNNASFNSWDSSPAVTVSSADFLTLDDTCAEGPRNTDGSLPTCNFLKLAAGSDLIDRGTNVGIAFNGSAPDLGAFETGGGPPPETVPPTVAITAPAAAATVSGTTVTVSADAADASGVAGVQFKLDGANLGAEDLTAPYSVVWNTTSQTNGSHTLTAVARDVNGNSATSAAITVTVDNPAPASPDLIVQSFTYNTTTNLFSSVIKNQGTGVTTTGPEGGGVIGVSYFVDGVYQTFGRSGGTDPEAANLAAGATLALGNNGPTFVIPAGTHTLRALTDENEWIAESNETNNELSQSITIGASDTTAPAVELTAPADLATVSGTTVTVSATATDAIGVVGVQFKLDGANLLAEDLELPYEVVWNTTMATNGSHTLTATARDAAGNSASAAIRTVTVDNAVPDTIPPTVSITAPADGSGVTGNVMISANAADNDEVSGVQFLVDAILINEEDTTPPYSTIWNSANFTNGQHSLTARARDPAGNMTTSNPVVVFSNIPPPTPKLQVSAEVQNAIVQTIEGQCGVSPRILFLSGTMPNDLTFPDAGSTIVDMTLPADWLGTPVNGVSSQQGVWRDPSANATGVASYARFKNTLGTESTADDIACIQGPVTLSGGGGLLTLPTLSVTAGQPVSITGFTFTAGNR